MLAAMINAMTIASDNLERCSAVSVACSSDRAGGPGAMTFSLGCSAAADAWNSEPTAISALNPRQRMISPASLGARVAFKRVATGGFKMLTRILAQTCHCSRYVLSVCNDN